MQPEDFWNRVDKSGECWMWTAYRDSGGYGRVRFRGKWLLAHRVAYEITFGSFNTKRCICHRCDNPGCVRPEHLFVGTHKDNMNDRDAKGRVASGDFAGRAVLCSEEVQAMRLLYSTGNYTMKRLSQIFNIRESTVGAALSGQTWKSVNERKQA